MIVGGKIKKKIYLTVNLCKYLVPVFGQVAGSVCSVSTWLYAGQACLLQELMIIPAAKAMTKRIVAFFIST